MQCARLVRLAGRCGNRTMSVRCLTLVHLSHNNSPAVGILTDKDVTKAKVLKVMSEPQQGDTGMVSFLSSNGSRVTGLCKE